MNRKTGIRQLITILLVIAMTVMIAIPVMAAQTGKFSDVPDGKWYSIAVNYCAQKGYVSGYGNGTFLPNKNLTRSEMAAIMNKKLGLKESTSNTFKDVASGKWYTDPILHCVKAGVMSGYDKTTFGTNDNLTREQGAVILAKAFDVEKVSGRTSFSDDSSISSWAVGSVKAMAAKGLISGMGNNRFEPKTPLTRAMMCQIIYAGEQKTVDPTPSPSGSPKPSDSPKPSENPIPFVPDDNENIQVGDILNTSTKDSWNTLLNSYEDEAIRHYGWREIDVDSDNNRELLIFGNRGSGNEKLITYHNGTVSVLPLNGAALAYVPKGNTILVGEYEDGTYMLSIYSIKNGKWTRQVQGSFQDPPGGPQQDEDGNGIYVNYKWNGKSVSEEGFYLGLVSAVGATNIPKMETIEK